MKKHNEANWIDVGSGFRKNARNKYADTEEKINKAKKNESIQIEYLPNTDEIGERVKISFGTLQYDLALINADDLKKEPKIPELNLPVKISMRCTKFRQTISLVNEISDQITFVVSDNKLIAEGTDLETKTHILTTIENGDLLRFEDERKDENGKKG